MDATHSDIRLFPLEILTLIFLESVPYPTRKNPGPPLSCRHPAVVLSHVCHDWRQLALATPILWSKMHIETPNPEDHPDLSVEGWIRKANEVTIAIETWDKRSAECPLTVVVDLHSTTFDVEGSNEVLDSYKRVLEQLLLCSKRWEKVVINLASSVVPIRAFGLSFLDVTANRFPILREVEMHVNPDERTVIVINLFSKMIMKRTFFKGPMLRSVGLGGLWYMVPGSLGEYLEGWAPLTELRIDLHHVPQGGTHLNTHHVLQMLESLPQLVKVSCVLQRDRSAQVAERRIPITLRHLQSLSLRGIPMGPHFARSLILPSLNAMYLVFDGYEYCNFNAPVAPPTAYEAGILELLRQFGSQLTALALNPELLTLESFPSCLECLDNDRLETLSLINEDFPTPRVHFDLYDADTREGLDYATLLYLAKPSVLTNLRYFEMSRRYLSPEGKCDMALVEVIAGRRKTVEAGSRDEEGSEAVVTGCLANEATGLSRRVPRNRLRHVQIAFSWPSQTNVVDELRRRRVDLDTDAFNLSLDYPGSCQGVGQPPERIWVEDW